MLDINTCEQVIEAGLETGCDFVEIFEEDKFSTAISQIDGKIEKVNSGNSYGIGIRLYHGKMSVYGSTNNNSLDNLITLAKDLAANFQGQATVSTQRLEKVVYTNKHPIEKYPEDFDMDYKKEIIEKAYHGAKDYSELISKVNVNYSDSHQKILVANSQGKYIEDSRVQTRIAVTAIVEKDGQLQDFYKAPGASKGLEFYDEIDLKQLGREVSEKAIKMFHAKECPSGVMDVVINNGFGGVIFHEACGHLLEATSVAKNQSIFANKIGEKIASELVSAVDDGTIQNAWGSSNIDDEGNFTQRNVLIEKGILKGYLVDQFNGRKMGSKSTGSGRRQSYHYQPTSRMNNTFITNGESTLDELIEATKFGLFAASLGGGSVNPATGDFNFAVQEGYLIEDGKITKPVKGASLVGNGAQVLQDIDMVANNLLRAQGMCGSASGSIPVDVGQPAIRVKKMTVGGRGGNI